MKAIFIKSSEELKKAIIENPKQNIVLDEREEQTGMSSVSKYKYNIYKIRK